MINSYVVFGDSHSECFSKVFTTNAYRAVSAKGLINPNSRKAVNKEIVEKISLLPKNSNIIMFFGKVDLDFIVNYKFNTTEMVDFKEYVLSIANSYLEFIKLNVIDKNIFICELPITHIDDESMLIIINNQHHHQNLNQYLSNEDNSVYVNFDKIISYKDRVLLYKLFNQELKSKCKIYNFKFLEINKYFIKENGQFDIPAKYINNLDKLDHHLLDISELYLKSLEQLDRQSILQQTFANKKNQKSDINEHLETLKNYASQCEHITEMGVREGVSTVAFLAANPKTLISYDISDCSKQYNALKKLCNNEIDFIFKKEDTTECSIEDTDLLFIDTEHTYEQLKKELSLHSSKVKKFIILHDTLTFKIRGELEGSEGLGKALDEFLSSNKEWIIKEVFDFNNGLTVLLRSE